MDYFGNRNKLDYSHKRHGMIYRTSIQPVTDMLVLKELNKIESKLSYVCCMCSISHKYFQFTIDYSVKSLILTTTLQ